MPPRGRPNDFGGSTYHQRTHDKAHVAANHAHDQHHCHDNLLRGNCNMSGHPRKPGRFDVHPP